MCSLRWQDKLVVLEKKKKVPEGLFAVELFFPLFIFFLSFFFFLLNHLERHIFTKSDL